MRRRVCHAAALCIRLSEQTTRQPLWQPCKTTAQCKTAALLKGAPKSRLRPSRVSLGYTCDSACNLLSLR